MAEPTYRGQHGRSEVDPQDVYALRAGDMLTDPARHEFEAMEDPASGSSRGRGVSPIVEDDLTARLELPRSTPVQKPTMPKRFSGIHHEGSD